MFQPYTTKQSLYTLSRCFHHGGLLTTATPKLIPLRWSCLQKTPITSSFVQPTQPSPWVQCVRNMSQSARSRKQQQDNRTTVIYLTAFGVFMIGMSYLGVPLYRMFCQVKLYFVCIGTSVIYLVSAAQ